MDTEEQQHTEETEDTEDRTPDARSFGGIRRDLTELEDRRDTMLAGDLHVVRERVRRNLSGVTEGGPAWKAIVSESEADLDATERATIAQITASRNRLMADRDQLEAVEYRCGLPDAERAAAEAKAAALAGRIQTASAAQLQRSLQNALLFSEPVELAAWALCGDVIESRFPADRNVVGLDGREASPRQLFGEALRSCESKTGDPAVTETRQRLDQQIERLDALLAGISKARAAHNPTGQVGGLLASFVFGRGPGGAEEVRKEREFDPEAVMTRLGRKVAFEIGG